MIPKRTTSIERNSKLACRAMWIIFVALGGTYASGEVNAAQDASVETAREALNRRGSFPWYDRTNDSIHRVPVTSSDSARSGNRDSDWVKSEKSNSDRPGGSSRSNGLGNAGSGAGDVIFSVLFWGIIAIILIAITFLIVWAIMRNDPKGDESEIEDWIRDGRTDEHRIESLPFEVAAKRNDLLAAARNSYEQGDVNQAVIYLYSYMLVRLDRGQRIHLARGKTNRQYLKEIKEYQQLQSLVERTMISFERVFFGKHDLPRPDFEQCWSAVDRFHQLVESPS